MQATTNIADSALSHAVAVSAVTELGLATANRALAEHWLSLWPGDALPPRAAFHPAKLKPFLASMLLFNVVPGLGVTVRLAGTGFAHILKTELTGADWIAAAPDDHRARRLEIFSTIARGAICVAHRRIAMSVGEDYISEEIMLPFAAEPGSTVQTVMVHVNFRPEQFLQIKSIKQVTGDPIDFRIVTLAR
jgi:hypothetical protein